MNNNQWLCSYECVKGYSDEKKVDKRVKEIKKELKDIKYYRNILQAVFNTYIRIRDENEPCISCGCRVVKGHASHYYSVGAHPSLRFDEYNVHKSCEKCNTHLHGNLIEYRKRLEKKIGKIKLLELDKRAREERKYSIDEIKEMIKEYRSKIKFLKLNK
jgi:hypothetical protein